MLRSLNFRWFGALENIPDEKQEKEKELSFHLYSSTITFIYCF